MVPSFTFIRRTQSKRTTVGSNILLLLKQLFNDSFLRSILHSLFRSMLQCVDSIPPTFKIWRSVTISDWQHLTGGPSEVVTRHAAGEQNV